MIKLGLSIDESEADNAGEDCPELEDDGNAGESSRMEEVD